MTHVPNAHLWPKTTTMTRDILPI